MNPGLGSSFHHHGITNELLPVEAIRPMNSGFWSGAPNLQVDLDRLCAGCTVSIGFLDETIIEPARSRPGH
jgi:hypothetical protein